MGTPPRQTEWRVGTAQNHLTRFGLACAILVAALFIYLCAGAPGLQKGDPAKAQQMDDPKASKTTQK